MENIIHMHHTYTQQESGCPFHVNGCEQVYYGTMTVFSADNLASNAVGGFKESSSAYRPCRQCLCANDELQHQVVDNHVSSY